MAYVDLNFYSYYLGMDTSAQVLLPEKRRQKPEDRSNDTYPVLYLLHGHSDYDKCFIRKSNIELLVRNHDLIIVMPNAHRSFYTNARHGLKYYSFVTEELSTIMANFFHVSGKREDRYIAGVSMGGYGAMKIALNNPDKYAGVASISGTIDPLELLINSKDISAELPKNEDMYENLLNIFGSQEDFYGSENEIIHVLRCLEKKNIEKPKIFQCCGTEDFLIQQNRRLNQVFNNEIKTIEHTYKEMPGTHNWIYWNKVFPEVMAFFGFPFNENMSV
jgi:S-formylglutathione hydrolase FrmB